MANKHTPTTERDQQILSRLARIQHKIDALEQTTAFALRADAEKHRSSVKAVFGKSKRRAQIYLAADGGRNVQDIAAHLGMKPPNVSRELSLIAEEGLLELREEAGSSSIWSKTPLDKNIRITKILTEDFNLAPDGKPVQAKASK